MNYEDIKIILPTCNKYIHLTQGLLYTLEKFWPDHPPVTILGYNSPNYQLNSNSHFISLGNQTGPNDWSNDLIKFFNNFKDDFFINIIDDTLMTRNTDVDQIKYLFNLTKNNSNIGKSFLHGSLISFNSFTEMKDHPYDLVSINQNSQYRSSIQSAIWRRDYFLKCLKPNLTPWSFELQHIKNDGFNIISTKSNHPTMYSHLYRNGGRFMKTEWFKSVFEPTELNIEDRNKLIKMLNLPV